MLQTVNPSNVKDRRFRILYALGMIFILTGHLDGRAGLNLMYDWFPATGFHVGLFAFCSGYFFKDSNTEQAVKYIVRKAKTLLLPLFLWNFFYVVVVLILSAFGFTIGTPVTLEKLFIEPITTGHQFGYNLGGWFVIPLFMIEVTTVLARRIMRHRNAFTESLFFLVSLCLGVSGVYFASQGYNDGWWLVLARYLLLLPFFSLGIYYNRFLEKYDTLPNLIYFAVILVLRAIVIRRYTSGMITVWAWCSNFRSDMPIAPFAIGFVPIFFWLRVAKILVPAIGNSRAVNAIADNTYSIMVNHIFGFMVLKGIFYILFRFTPLCQGFDCDALRTDIWYIYTPFYESIFNIVYLVFGLGVPIIMQKVVDVIKTRIKPSGANT